MAHFEKHKRASGQRKLLVAGPKTSHFKVRYVWQKLTSADVDEMQSDLLGALLFLIVGSKFFLIDFSLGMIRYQFNKSILLWGCCYF